MDTGRRESSIQRGIRLALSERFVLWRNNSGVATFPDGSIVRYGVGDGGSDLIGIERGTGRFVAVECKNAKNKLTPKQAQFLELVRNCGGIAVVARSVEDVEFLQKNLTP